MPPRIAIPMPHSTDHEYSERAIPQYERAVQIARGEPVRIPLDIRPAELRVLVENCEGVLLPGSKADVDPTRFGQKKSGHTANADFRREEVDDFLLEHAYAHRKPVLGICYGLQSLNVFRRGSLIQHIPDFLPEETRAKVNHEAGRTVAVAHDVSIETDSSLAGIIFSGTPASLLFGSKGERPQTIPGDTKESRENREGHGLSRADQARPDNGPLAPEGTSMIVPVNSSHHQSVHSIGEGLRIVARCPDDGIVEALEGTAPDHFVVAVQWHPERSVEDDEHSLRIFQAFVDAAGLT
jgi:putative glutamine amidotransferase